MKILRVPLTRFALLAASALISPHALTCEPEFVVAELASADGTKLAGGIWSPNLRLAARPYAEGWTDGKSETSLYTAVVGRARAAGLGLRAAFFACDIAFGAGGKEAFLDLRILMRNRMGDDGVVAADEKVALAGIPVGRENAQPLASLLPWGEILVYRLRVGFLDYFLLQRYYADLKARLEPQARCNPKRDAGCLANGALRDLISEEVSRMEDFRRSFARTIPGTGGLFEGAPRPDGSLRVFSNAELLRKMEEFSYGLRLLAPAIANDTGFNERRKDAFESFFAYHRKLLEYIEQ